MTRDRGRGLSGPLPFRSCHHAVKLHMDEDTEDITVAAERTPAEPGRLTNGFSYGNRNFVFLPAVFLTVALLGGLRIGLSNGEFVFVRPALVCLIFAVLLLTLFVRAKLIELDGWFSDRYTALENASGAALLISLYAASVQVFNSLIPENGFPFWIVSFCFLWTLWNNLFAQFDVKRLFQSLGGLFVFAFAFKYMVLLNLATRQSDSWWGFLTSGNLTAEAISNLLAVPPYSGATGYIQFFSLGLFLIGLFFLKPRLFGQEL